MENEHDQADDQQDVDEAGANVKCEKAQQPENNQNQSDKSKHSFASSSSGEQFRESCGSPSRDGRLSEGHYPRHFRRAGAGNLCSLKQCQSERGKRVGLPRLTSGREGVQRRLQNARF